MNIENTENTKIVNPQNINPEEVAIARTDIDHLHNKFRDYGQNAKEWKRKCSLLLPDIEKHQVWRKKGFSSIYEYAAKLAGMSQGQVDDALRILRKISDKPKLMEVAKGKGLNAVRPVATIATVKTDAFWAKKAEAMSKYELAVYVKTTKSQNDNKTKLESVTFKLKPEIVIKLKKLNKGDINELMREFIELYEKEKHEKLEKEKPNHPGENGKKSRHIPLKIKQYIIARANGKCEFPSCCKNYDQLHHVDRYSSAKNHNPDRIVALCRAHHSLAHRGLIEENADTSKWHLKKLPDLTALNNYIDEKVQFYRRI